MAQRTGRAAFLLLNALVWVLMTTILVLVPDSLERWLGLEVARVVGWAVACGAWVVVVESAWKIRYGPFTRFAGQFVLWVSAAMVAMWISELARAW
ncbi:MAG: hypothetical protein ABI634_10970 [Acidobacteriota bacterium]